MKIKLDPRVPLYQYRSEVSFSVSLAFLRQANKLILFSKKIKFVSSKWDVVGWDLLVFEWGLYVNSHTSNVHFITHSGLFKYINFSVGVYYH